MRKIKANNNFSPCQIDDDDEIYRNGMFHFNITKMLEYIHDNGALFQVEEIRIRDYVNQGSHITESHIDSVDVSKPVILAEIAPSRYNIIDGNHRMEKARRLGVDKISAYRVTVEHHTRFLTDKKAYLSYIEYWNGKLK
mgnify:CR=1 FL=1